MTKSRQQHFSYNLIARIFIPLFLFCERVWPMWLKRAFAWIVTAAYYPFFTKRRHAYQANLKHILGPGTSNWRLFTTTFRMLVNCANYMTDLFGLGEDGQLDMDSRLSNASGYENITDALKGGKGAILLTAHLGNWEMGGIVLAQLGHPVNVVYYPDGSERIEASRTRQRLMRGVKEIRLDPDNLSPLAMMRALQAGELVALQGDKLYNDKGVKMQFFDAPAYFPKGPSLLSIVTGAPIVPAFIVIDKNHRYNIIVETPIYPVKTGDRDADIEANLKSVVAVLEKYIGLYYEQWYCMTRFWEE